MVMKTTAKIFVAFATFLSTVVFAQAQSNKPATLKLGITTFLSGPASVFGVPAKAAAELWIDEFNAAGGIDGVKLAPVFIDEGLGGDKVLSEERRVVPEPCDNVMLSAISRGHCNTRVHVAVEAKCPCTIAD